MRHRAAAIVPVLLVALACANGPPPPAELVASSGEACRWCRMVIAEPRTAAQLIAPLEDPLFFDDIGCLRDYLKSAGPSRPGAIAYVADHRTGAWVRASLAAYTTTRQLETPMGSRLVAHRDAASRDADPVTAQGEAVSTSELFGPGGPPDGNR